MAGIYSQGGSAGHRYAGWLETVEAKNFQFGGKVFNGSPSAIYVGSNLVWMLGWLEKATQQAILGAFGQRDGMAVINATNAYLTQLAASGQAGKDKATALADVLNANPQNAVMAKYVADYGDSFAHMVLDLGVTSFEIPIIAIDAQNDAERKWLYRAPANFTNWTQLDTLMAQTDWASGLGGFTNNGSWVTKVGTTTSSNKTIFKMFVPSQMPAGFTEAYADNLWVYVNGTLIFGKNGSYHSNKVAHNYDFSGIIEVGKPNYIVYAWTGGGGNGADVGLYY